MRLLISSGELDQVLLRDKHAKAAHHLRVSTFSEHIIPLREVLFMAARFISLH